MFNENFLARENNSIFGYKINGVFKAGCLGNRSKDCIGLSNVFSTNPICSIEADDSHSSDKRA